MTELIPVPVQKPPVAVPRSDAALFPAEVDAALVEALVTMAVTTGRVAPIRTPQGGLVLQTAKGPIVLPTGPDLPPGAEIELRLVARTPTLVSVRVLPTPDVPAPAAEIVRAAPLAAVLLAAPPDDARPPGTPLLARVLSMAAPVTMDGAAVPPPAFDRPSESPAIVASSTSPLGRPLSTQARPGDQPNSQGAPENAAGDGLETGPGLDWARASVGTRSTAGPENGAAAPPLLRHTPPGAAATPRSAAWPTGPAIGAAPLPPSLQEPPRAARLEKALAMAPATFVEGELVGPVVTRTAAGVVVATPSHTVAIEGLDAPEGSLIHFVLLDPPVAAPSTRRPMPRTPWAALGEALHTLEADAPEAAERLAADLQPREPPRLAATLRYIAAALRDDALPWPSPALEQSLVDAGRPDLVPVLRDEARALGRAAAEPASQWQVHPLPIHDGAQLAPAFLYVERDARRDPQTGEEARRFVLDVQTRLLGRLQLDGLLRGHRFDLLLRSRVPLDRVMRGEIEEIFRATLDTSGWTGEVAFTTSPAFTDEPAAQLRGRVAATV